MTQPVVTASTSNVVARSDMSAPNQRGAGMPEMPFQPPVNSLHSAAPCSTTKPNAMVTIARYGPRTRSAGIASSAPATPAISVASGSASQKPSAVLVVRMPTV